MKTKARSKLLLEEWHRDNYWRIQDSVLVESDKAYDSIEYVDIAKISTTEFIKRYERVSKPCILTGVSNEWPA